MMRIKSMLVITVILLLAVLILSNHSDQSSIPVSEQVPDEAPVHTIIYEGQSAHWLATFSLYKVDHSWFESIYIQYTGDHNVEVGPIEYELIGQNYKGASSYPQPLQGVFSFQVSTQYNADFFDLQTFQPTADGTYKLTVKSLIGTEILSLEPLLLSE